MEELRFKTRVMKNGFIQLPTLKLYENDEVEIIVKLKTKSNPKKPKKSIQAFFDKWTVFFDTIQTDDIRYEALMEKYK